MADALLKVDVGSEPDPPKGAASFVVTHRPSEQIPSVAQSPSIEHSPTDAGGLLVALGLTRLLVTVTLAVGFAVSSAIREKISEGVADSSRKEVDLVGRVRGVLEAGCCGLRVAMSVVDIMNYD